MNDHYLVDLARVIAYEAHSGQVDQAGRPYIEHPARVALWIAESVDAGAEAIAAAWLHDVIEDTPIGAADLEEAGIPPAVIEAVVALSKTGGPLDAYYARVRANPIARLVKLADVADNMDPDRLALLPVDTAARLLRKYAKALEALA